MKKIIITEWAIATTILAIFIIQLREFEPELVNSLASYVKQAIQIIG